MSHKHNKFLLIFASLLALACSREKDTLPARVYHTTTSYFNWYYNANLLYQESIVKIEDQNRFDDKGFMEIVRFLTPDESKSYEGDFEAIVKKNDAVLFKHPNGEMVDECRLLNGKCWFYRNNFTSAIQNFRYVINHYPDSKRLADAYFYLALTYYQMNNRIMAEDILNKHILENDTLELSDQIFGEIGLFLVKLAIEDDDNKKAERILAERLDYIEPTHRNIRSRFLLAQLQSENDLFSKSLVNYQEVAKTARDYDLAFMAKLNIAKLYLKFQEGRDDDGEVFKYLTKLLKDIKNEEYRDQIYYELAMLSLKKENKPEAVEYLKYSLRYNRNNQRQKALSYYKIGQIYFYDYQDYPMAQAYYDSAASSIQPDAIEYDEITRLAKTLKEYITYLNTIQYQDSMLHLATLPEEELEAIVEKLIEEEQRQKEREAAQLLENSFANNNIFLQQELDRQNRNNNSQTGQWYFDNQTTVSQGQIQFKEKWGERPNEDNWRRKNKAQFLSASAAATGSDVKEGDSDSDSGNGIDSSLVEQYGDNAKYYKDIPKTDEDIAEAKAKIEKAYFGLGQVYYQKLQEMDSAIQSFETLLDRFPDSEYLLPTHYALYKIYKEEKRNTAFRDHAQFILDNYPNTVYAYLILGKDPNELQKDLQDFMFVYRGLLDAYANKSYESSLGFSEFILSQEQYIEKEDIDLARVRFIRGMSYGYTGNQDSLYAILTKLVKDYPDHEVTPRAKATLGYVLNGIPEDQGLPTGGDSSDDYALDDPNNPIYNGFTNTIKTQEKIFVILFIQKDHITKDDARNRISDFNLRKYKSNNLKAFVFLYQQTHWLPYIANFTSEQAAQDYIQTFMDSGPGKRILAEGDKIMYMAHSNFKVAYGQKRMEDYIKYFDNILTNK